MLTQLSTIKTRLALSDATYDALLTDAIKAVSARFDRECGRAFARVEAATHEFDAIDREVLPPVYPIETVTRFEVKSSEAEGWLERTPDYLLRRSCVISLAAALGTRAQIARVTYTGGYVLPGTTPSAGQTPLPSDIEHAAVEQVAAWFYNRDKAGLVRYWPDVGAFVVLVQEPLLPSVAAILRKHRRWNG